MPHCHHQQFYNGDRYLPEVGQFQYCNSKARLIAEESTGHSREAGTGVEGGQYIQEPWIHKWKIEY